MCFGSDTERTFQGECRTTEDVRVLFERYRTRAREAVEELDRVEHDEREPQVEPVVAGR